jgi:hypothetical protein
VANSEDHSFLDSRDRWVAFIEERKTLLETAEKASDQYAKAILTLAGGSLALSITFIKEIAPSPGEHSLVVLALAWISFALSMLVTATYFLLGQFAYIHQIDLSQEVLLSETPVSNPQSNRYSPWMKWLQIAGLLFFALGLTLTVAFASANLKSRAKKVPSSENSQTPATQISK